MPPKKRRDGGRIRDGDGSALKPFHWWQMVWRSLFFAVLGEQDGQRHTYAVDFDFFDWDGCVYRDGVQIAVATLPARFPVPGGVLDVATSTFGVTRIHYLPEGGGEFQLRPHPHSAEGLRAAFGRRHPVTSRIIGWAAIAILLVSLALLVPQLLELVTRNEWVADNIGTFTSPITLPEWLNAVLGGAAVLASIERVLTIRNNWLIDFESWWFDL